MSFMKNLAEKVEDMAEGEEDAPSSLLEAAAEAAKDTAVDMVKEAAIDAAKEAVSEVLGEDVTDVLEAAEEAVEAAAEVVEAAGELLDQEDREELVEELKEEIAEQIGEEIQERIEEIQEEIQEERNEAYWANVAEESKNTADIEVSPPDEDEEDDARPPPQPAPRATLDERAENLRYWHAENGIEEVEAEEVNSKPMWQVKNEIRDELKERIQESDIREEDTVVTITHDDKVIVNDTVVVSEKDLSDREVLEKMVAEGDVEPMDMPSIAMLLTRAKASRKPKTETFVIRAKKKQESIRRAVDYNSVAIVIEDKTTTTTTTTKSVSNGTPKRTVRSGGRIFEVSSAAQTFQVRKSSSIQPSSETVVTKKWIEMAIQSYEQDKAVEIEEMKFETKKNADGGGSYYEASVVAKVSGTRKEYSWIIREAPKASGDPNDKNVFIVSDLGSKIASFVASKKLRKRLTLPFRPVIYADARYAILDDMEKYRPFSATPGQGLDLEHAKQALKALAKLHAMSYAFFHQGDGDVKAFSETLRFIINKDFQPAATLQDRKAVTEELNRGFENLLALVRSTGDAGDRLAERAQKQFGDRLYVIFKEANMSSSSFSVLCHGFPTPNHIQFLYGADDRPVDVKLTGFTRARYAHAVTDLQLLFAVSLAPRVEEQTEFLLRFVYFETLTSTLRALGVTNAVDFDSLKKDFKKKQVYGCLAGGMALSSNFGPVRNGVGRTVGGAMRRAPTTGVRTFESKIVGKISNVAPRPVVQQAVAQAVEENGPAMKARQLLERAVALI